MMTMTMPVFSIFENDDSLLLSQWNIGAMKKKNRRWFGDVNNKGVQLHKSCSNIKL